MSFPALFLRIILRDLARHRAQALLTFTGVMLGIAVVVAVQLANERAVGSFNDSLDILNGQSDLQISANGRPVDEELIEALSWVWDVGAMTAIVEGRVQRPVPEQESLFGQDSIRLFGVDLLSDAPFRTYTVSIDPGAAGGEPPENLGLEITRNQFIDLLVDPQALILPSALAREWDVGPGDGVELLVANRLRSFTVGTILEDEGIARAFNGRIVFMDIAAAQLALDRIGELDRIEVVLDDPERADEVAARAVADLPESVIVYRPEDRGAQVQTMTRAFRYNLAALSYIALVVGVILIYNTLNIAVVRRRVEIGVLRALGTSRGTIRWLFLTEAVSFGVCGAVAGVWVGELLSRVAGALVSRTIAELYTGIALTDVGGGVEPSVYVQMVLLGAALAAVSGAGPAIRATRVSPVDIMRDRISKTTPGRWTLPGVAALALGIGLAFAPPVAGFPFLGYVAGVCFIVGFGFLSLFLVSRILWVLRAPVVAASPVSGRLALDTISGRLNRVVVAVVSLAIAVAMLVSVVTMVASFRDTVVVWVDQTLRGDLYMRPVASGADSGRNTMAPASVEILAGVAGIAAIDRYRAVAIDYDGFGAFLASGEFETLARYGRLLFTDGLETVEVAGRLVGSDRVIVSEPFAVRHGVARGDTIVLPTPAGGMPFEIAGVFFDYSSEGGLVVMDRGTYVSRFDDDAVSNVAVYLDSNADPEEVRGEIVARLDGVGARIATNGELRGQVLRVFDQTFEVTYALEVIALLVAVLGVANTLAALILERRRELAMLRFIGASRSQIRRVIAFESGLVGVLGSGIGLALGILLSLLLVYVINFQSFGWTIQFTLPVAFLVQSTLAVTVVTTIAGLYPAALALRMDPIRGVREE